MDDIAKIVWIVARDYRGSTGICVEASSDRTVERFLARAEAMDRGVEYIERSMGRHWDGSRLSAAELRRVKSGIARNAA